jgi:hypothetical protein
MLNITSLWIGLVAVEPAVWIANLHMQLLLTRPVSVHQTSLGVIAELEIGGGSASIGMAKSASIDVGCGTYSYKIDVPTGADFTTCQPGLTPPVGQHCEPGQENCRQPSVWPRSALLAAAHQYCFPSFGWVAVTPYVNYGDAVAWYGWFDTNVIDPVTNLPGYCNGQAGQFQWPDHAGTCTPGSGKNSKAALQVNPSADQSYCWPMKDHTLPTGQACVDMFTHVIDKCKFPFLFAYVLWANQYQVFRKEMWMELGVIIPSTLMMDVGTGGFLGSNFRLSCGGCRLSWIQTCTTFSFLIPLIFARIVFSLYSTN